MPNEVELSVNSELKKLIEELSRISDAAKSTSDAFSDLAKKTGDTLQDQTKKTESFMSRLAGLTRNVGKRIGDDFKALVSVNALAESLRLSNQFRDSVKETVSLSDSIRKLGNTFGIARKDYANFQTSLTKGLGAIGASSDAAARVLEGLADAPIRGQKSLEEYAKTATMLASITREQGKEGIVAGGLSKTLVAQGINPNDITQMQALAGDVAKASQATGKGATQILSAMEELFTKMPQDLRRKVGPKALTQLAVVSQTAGPQATKFLEKYLSLAPEARAGLQAQGIGNVIGKGGNVDINAIKAIGEELQRRGTSPRLAAQTMGFSEEEAEGLVRLVENADRAGEALKNAAKASGDLAKLNKENKTLGEAFRGNINRVKGMLARPLAATTQGLTDVFTKTGGSDIGAGATVLGGGLLAALLAGGGLRGVGKALGGGKGAIGTLGRGALAEQVTGQKTIPVYVVNASEIGGGGGGGLVETASKAGGVLGKLGKGAGMAGAALGAFGVGAEIGNAIMSTDVGKAASDKLADAMIDLAESIGILKTSSPVQRVRVDLNKKDLKETPEPGRGASYGP